MIYEKMCTALKAFSTALLKQLDFYISSTFSIVEASFSRAFLAVTQGFLHARRIFDYAAFWNLGHTKSSERETNWLAWSHAWAA